MEAATSLRGGHTGSLAAGHASCLQLIVLLTVLGRGNGRGWSRETSSVSIDYVRGPLMDTVRRFRGNATITDNFKILVQDGLALYLGATNTVYILNSRDMTEHQDLRITWPPDSTDYELCLVKGKTKEQCQNHIRVIGKTEKSLLLICGTHAFKPKCRYYRYKDGNYSIAEEFDGKCLTPYDPAHNSSYILSDGELYTATVSDFSGSDPLIFRDPQRTEQYDSKILNDPDFVRILEDDNFVYFFFREQAVEYINCGKSVFSRVGRVCKEDRGGPNKFKQRWTTYLKSRLNCSIPGDYPFYFDHLQSVSDLITGDYMGAKTTLVYAVFTTPDNSIGGNAICAFKLEDILGTFEGQFKEQETANSNWLPVRDIKVPEPRPGQCAVNSEALPENSVRFIQDHSIMDEAVPAFFGGKPVFVRSTIEKPGLFREIVIDPGVKTGDTDLYDVIFIGTDRGQVLKMAKALNQSKELQDPHVIEELQVVPLGEPILGLKLVEGQLIVTTGDELLQLPLHRCSVAVSCSTCVGLRDPYCGWNILSSRCEANSQVKVLYASEFLQNITHGKHRQCGDNEPNVLIEQFTHDVKNSGASINRGLDALDQDSAARRNGGVGGGLSGDVDEMLLEGRYTTEQLSMAVATSCVSALIIGFIFGFLLSRKCECGEDNTYHVPYLNRSGYEEENIYAKVDDMTYYPVVPQVPPPPMQETLNKQNMLNNLMLSEHVHSSKTLDLHHQGPAGVNKQPKDMNSFNAFSTVHRSQKIYL